MNRVNEIITPERAKQLLSTRSRDYNVKRVNAIKELMSSGKWVIDNGFFIIVRKGVLMNGRHRLRAVVELDKPIEMRVQYD